VGAPGVKSTELYGINNRPKNQSALQGQIVGDYHVDKEVGGYYLYPPPFYSAIFFPGAVNVWARGINDEKIVVGYYQPNKNKSLTHGFLYDAGKVTVIDYPHALTTQVFGINNPIFTDTYEIVGAYSDTNGQQHGFDFVGQVSPGVGNKPTSQAEGRVKLGIDDVLGFGGPRLDTVQ
jgi:hypothetical protein